MKITKLNGRYNANKRWGYTYSITFNGFDWKKFYAFKAQAKSMFGDSVEVVRHYMWKTDAELLKSAPWAFHYEKSSKPMIVYFRDKTEMDQCMMMFALTNTVL